MAEQPTSAPAAKGQEPSGNCAECRYSRPRPQTWAGAFPLAISACSAQQVASTRLAEPTRNPQPPSSFCALRKAGRQTLSTKSADCVGGEAMSPPRAEKLSNSITFLFPGIAFIRFGTGAAGNWPCPCGSRESSSSRHQLRPSGFLHGVLEKSFFLAADLQLIDEAVQVASGHAQGPFRRRTCRFQQHRKCTPTESPRAHLLCRPGILGRRASDGLFYFVWALFSSRASTVHCSRNQIGSSSNCKRSSVTVPEAIARSR